MLALRLAGLAVDKLFCGLIAALAVEPTNDSVFHSATTYCTPSMRDSCITNLGFSKWNLSLFILSIINGP